MITLLVVFGLAVGCLVALGAWATEGIARLAAKPTRWVWIGALALTAALIALAPIRSISPAPPLPADVLALANTSEMRIPVTLPAAAPTLGDLFAGMTAMVAAIGEWLRPFDGYVVAAWAGSSLLLLGLYGIVLVRFRRMGRSWPATDLCGVRVRLAPDGGPVVVGLARSEIVVPRWLLDYSEKDQRLVLAHEREHVSARDPLLLGTGCFLTALMPWHPAAWWMLSRLRLAVEMDCDVRVLRKGVPARAYGELLVDLAGRCAGVRLGATALAAESSQLGKRLLAMKPSPSRFTSLRMAVFGALASAALVMACGTRVPEVAPEPVTAAAEPAIAVPGTPVAPDSRPAPPRPPAAPPTVVQLDPGIDTLVQSGPLIIIDGQRLGRLTKDEINLRVARDNIATVEVMKGGAALSTYGPEASNGVIIIYTKAGSAPARRSEIPAPADTIVILDGVRLGRSEGRDALENVERGAMNTIEVRVSREIVDSTRAETGTAVYRITTQRAGASGDSARAARVGLLRETLLQRAERFIEGAGPASDTVLREAAKVIKRARFASGPAPKSAAPSDSFGNYDTFFLRVPVDSSAPFTRTIRFETF